MIPWQYIFRDDTIPPAKSMMNKKQVRIYFTDFWKGFNVHDNFFYNLFSKRFDISIDPVNPELHIYSYTGYNFLKYPSAVRLFYTGENKRPNFMKADFSLSFNYSDFNKRNLRLPLYVLYGGAEILLRRKTRTTSCKKKPASVIW